ncbi:non-ribosomal peptide synthetase [Cupriavidus agavae]|uniref:Amino acid adenylation domain-containing protein n=1 Tax=Cupriavidus agavae TaxID=1001822 RepID=A0A4Q7RZ28_9BURK|nr:amino acid adenylation domain-containing protein [Cupriavidus agavae]RZT39146.1 amino acid adenylation domain-containing protein [Cupriavidus agavae]
MSAILNTFATLDGHAQPLGREQRALEAHAAAPITLTALVDGALDAARLEQALASVAQRHPATGLVFGRVEGLRGLRQHFAGTAPRVADIHAGPDMPALTVSVSAPDPARTAVTLAAHPLALDGTSLATLLRELAAAYANDGHAASDEPPLSYADYLDWTAGLAQDNVEPARDYWQGVRDRLMPLDAPRLPWRQRAHGVTGHQVVAVDLGEEEAAAIVGWAGKLGVPAVQAMQAAWWLLLARLDPAAPFCAGWRNDCRDDFEALAGAVGCYTSVLPVVVHPDPAQTFGGWLAGFAAQLQHHVDWREHAPADIAAGAASRVTFAVTGAAGQPPVAGWELGTTPLLLPDAELVLAVRLDSAGQPQSLALHHSAHYPDDAAACLLDQYRTLLRTLRAQPATAVGELPLATAADLARARALHAPARDFGTEMLPQRLAHWARERPQAPALSAQDQMWTYAELATRVDAIAARLPALGLQPGQPVGLCLPRSAELVIALLAVMRAGSPYLPLDPAWPAQRRAQIVADAGAPLVLDGSAMAPLMAADPDCSASLPRIEPASNAYVLYTSGSTGTPKGVPITHGQLLNYVAAVGEALALNSCTRFALTSTVAADLGNTTLFGALWQGACLSVADDRDMQQAASFRAFLAREQVDCIKIVPSHLDALLDGADGQLPLPPHAVVVMGGEAASPAFLDRLREQAPQARLCNHYGPTETTVGILVHDARRAADLAGHLLPLTRVLANCEAQIRTPAGHPATAGETGELYLGGAQLCTGYLNGPADAFVTHPEHPARRLYRTGDLARYRPQGGIELVGRADSQVKVRGFRVECGEIEQVLAMLPGVRQAVVLPLTAAGGATQLAAWLVPDAPASAVAGAHRSALRQALAERLPDAMIPSQWFVVAELPRLPNGKVDRRALVQDAMTAQPETREPAREPATALEALLLDQMRDLLGESSLGVTGDLFEAGGHSLLVIKLVARVRKLLKIEIAPAVVFDAPNAAALAVALQAASSDPAALETLAGLHRQLAAMSPEARAALRATASAAA